MENSSFRPKNKSKTSEDLYTFPFLFFVGIRSFWQKKNISKTSKDLFFWGGGGVFSGGTEKISCQRLLIPIF